MKFNKTKSDAVFPRPTGAKRLRCKSARRLKNFRDVVSERSQRSGARRLKTLVVAIVAASVFAGTQAQAAAFGCNQCLSCRCAPFGGFFARLFGWNQSWSCGSCDRAASCSTCPDGVCPIGASPVGSCSTCPGGVCPIDASPVGSCDSVEALNVEKYETPPADLVAPCGSAEKTTVDVQDVLETCSELEGRLVAAAIRARGRSLRIDRRLCQWARYNSRLQANWGRVGHYAGGGWEIAAPGRTPEEAVQMWLNSPAHRRILLGGFTRVGAGAVQSSSGVIFWTLRFE